MRETALEKAKEESAQQQAKAVAHVRLTLLRHINLLSHGNVCQYRWRGHTELFESFVERMPAASETNNNDALGASFLNATKREMRETERGFTLSQWNCRRNDVSYV